MPNRYADIYSFPDFRGFLAAYLQERRKKEKGFTQTRICERMGLPNSRSFLGDVIRGFKPLTAPKMEDLIGILELPGEEAKYFRTLVLHNQSSTASERGFYLEQLVALNRSPASILDRMAYEYYSRWYHTTVRALLDVVDVQNDIQPLAKRIFPKLSLARVKASMRLLKKLGLIRKDEVGFWKPSEKSIHCGEYAQDEIIRKYQVECLEVAKGVVLDPGDRRQNFSTESISISEKGYLLIEDRLQKFKSEVLAIVQKEERDPDRVYQLNIQFYPHSN